MAFTFFFRDSETLDLAIDQMMSMANAHDPLEIWDAGCAHGPEPYTLAILLREKLPEAIFRNVRIHATDVDPEYAHQVIEGNFSENDLRRMPDGYFEKYFEPGGESGRYRLVEEIRSKVSFSCHDLLSLKSFRKNCSMIVCKNVLLHFNERQRIDVLRMFHHSLRTEGVLVMEQTQKIPEEVQNRFRQLVPHAQVFGIVVPAPKLIFRHDPPARIRRPFFDVIEWGDRINDPSHKKNKESA